MSCGLPSMPSGIVPSGNLEIFSFVQNRTVLQYCVRPERGIIFDITVVCNARNGNVRHARVADEQRRRDVPLVGVCALELEGIEWGCHSITYLNPG
ncbi:unnamed protein product [Sphagnum balticum]